MSAWLLACALVVAAAPQQPSKAPWFSQTVEWQYGREALPWERVGALPGSASVEYRVALQPLWAVEGGILGFEIILATADRPFDNLLGERDPKFQQPFAFYLRDLQRGIGSSKFGATRTFRLPKPAQGRLRIQVLGWKPGKGVGSCDDCPNIDALTAKVEIDEE
jgi:hypothetical protein